MRINTYMEKAEIKRIAVYFKDLEKGLDLWDYRGLPMDRYSEPAVRDNQAIDGRHIRDRRPAAKAFVGHVGVQSPYMQAVYREKVGCEDGKIAIVVNTYFL
ncbi:MAG: hypothetical protein ACFFCW_44450 [Candidatus Hodarchaeota archaeon]